MLRTKIKEDFKEKEERRSLNKLPKFSFSWLIRFD